MTKVSLKVAKAIVDQTNNRVYIVAQTSKYNESGAYRVSMQQFNNLAIQSGLKDMQQLIRNIKGATLTFDANHVKAGEEWVNKKTSEGGKYTVDHWRIDNMEIEISQAKLFVIEAAANADFSFNDFFGSTGGGEDAEDVESSTEQENGEVNIAEPIIEQPEVEPVA